MTAPKDILELRPIGVLRAPHREKLEAPRQPRVASKIEGQVHLHPGRNLEHAIEDLEGWGHLWLLFWFHLNEGWRPKVLPPRSQRRRGVLSTRSPHRPNPIGLSVVKLERIEGLILHVSGVDMVDGTPILDIKPYVPYTDAIPDARSGWMESPDDPLPSYEVVFAARARAQLDYLRDAHDVDALESSIVAALALGPQPHPYRRIRPDGDALRLAYKEWRVRFRAEGERIEVLELESGYRASQLNGVEPELEAHRAFVSRFQKETG